MKLSFSLFLAALAAGVSASNVLDLDPQSWDSVVGNGKSGLVEFFATWCGHCKNLAPTYEQVADAYAHAKDKVFIAKIDADGVGKEVGRKYGVTGFPTLKWFNADGSVEPYESGRDIESFTKFITDKSGVKSNIKPPPPPSYKILDYNDFDQVVLDKSKDVLVTFTAPWCGHCKALKPTYEQLGSIYELENDVIIANIDADDKKNEAIRSRYGITGFPTIKFFPKDNKDGEDYDRGRDLSEFVSFINNRAGTHRSLTGDLLDNAGRLAEFDALASKFYVASADLRDSIFKEAVSLSVNVGDAAKHYLRVMEKMVNGTEAYYEKESKRLESILKKRSLSPAKLDEIKVKSNILRAFAEKPSDDDTTIRRASGEL
ncbi:hypothetical protein GYMLUDRAFT_222900 [Collybiopsis luxurians FD-317 M1]|uniref:protein disulfide-isomerase n=1 Tax=Collybiopsis luxurians FD-317 M1 TaxID=944289 RepID=A0A0D0CJT2_9AGAR|nr:hypothetical protein GYMLUDRAFT_222900 [Collybiopsis luxurians FD-317 M1]